MCSFIRRKNFFFGLLAKSNFGIGENKWNPSFYSGCIITSLRKIKAFKLFKINWRDLNIMRDVGKHSLGRWGHLCEFQVLLFLPYISLIYFLIKPVIFGPSFSRESAILSRRSGTLKCGVKILEFDICRWKSEWTQAQLNIRAWD